jgi:putative ABC transport system permease protein
MHRLTPFLMVALAGVTDNSDAIKGRDSAGAPECNIGRNSLLIAMIAELRRQFPTAEPPNVKTMESALEPELRPWRLGSTLFSLFGAIALLIAAFGLYSVVSYSVSQRTRELGIRAALGADSRMLVSQVTRQALRAPVVGLVVGIVLALLLWLAISAMVYGVKPGNPMTLATVGALLLLTAIVATVVPAIRAARVDVVKALRAD